jgi:sphinganine-1-phosphate aldolase
MSLTLPARGLPHDEILDRLKDLREGDADWREGRVFSLVYHAGDEHGELVRRAHNLFFSENGLNPMAFKSLRRMEAEVVRIDRGDAARRARDRRHDDRAAAPSRSSSP